MTFLCTTDDVTATTFVRSSSFDGNCGHTENSPCTTNEICLKDVQPGKDEDISRFLYEQRWVP